jgi:hypothetical protein
MRFQLLGSLIVCSLLMVTSVPPSGLASQPGKTIGLKTKLSFLKEATLSTGPPGPGDMALPYPGFDLARTAGAFHQHRNRAIGQPSDFVTDLIQQVNESLFLHYLQNLTGFGPRNTGSTACQAAAAYLYSQFEDMGLTVRYDNWSSSGYEGSNIEATLPGTDHNDSEIFIICGHYDSVSVSPGADDDGSGTVATIIAASPS